MYGLKYHASCLDYYGNEIRCEIYGKDYSGDAKEMEFGEEAVKLVRTNKAVTEPICGMGVKIQVWCNTDAEYIDLFATSDKQHMVVIYRAGAVVFRGFVEPDLYNEEFIAPPYTITIPAADGLAGLNDYVPALDFSQEKATLLSLIRACLSETGMELPIFIDCSLFPDDVQADTLFEAVYVETSVFRTLAEGIWQVDDAQKILGDILRPFSCRIYQANDAWYIERIKNKCDASWKWVRYDLDGSKATVADFHTVTLDTDEASFMDNPASLEMDSGYGKQTVKIDYKKYDSVILNNFSQGFIREKSLDPTYHGQPLRRWIYTWNDDPPQAGTNLNGIAFYAKLGSAISGHPDMGMYQHSLISHSEKGKLHVKFKFSFVPARTSYNRAFYLHGCVLVADINDPSHPKTLCYSYDSATKENKMIWKDFSMWSFIYGVNGNEEYKNGFNKSISVDFTVDFPVFATLSYRKYIGIGFYKITEGDERNPVTQTIVREGYVGDIEIMTEDSVQDDNLDNTFTATVNTKYRRKAPDIQMKLYDLPSYEVYDTENPQQLLYSGINVNYSQGLSIGDALTDYTTSWRDEVEDNTQKDKLYERLLIDNFDQYYDPREKLSGDVLTDVLISPEKLFRVAGRDKYYLLTGLEYRMAEAMYKVSVEEIKKRQVSINAGK